MIALGSFSGRMKSGLLAGLILFVSTLLFAGCLNEGAELQENLGIRHKIVAYGVKDTQISAQQIIAQEKGYFQEEGLEVENRLVESGGEIPALIKSGEAQVSFESPYTVVALAAEGVKVRIVAPMADIGNTQCVVARGGAGIVNGKDFEGKKIGMADGSGILLAIRNMCYDLGVDMNKITFVPLSPGNQLAAMESGEIDAMACWEPWVGVAQENGGRLLFSGLKSYLGDRQGEVDWLSFYTTMQVTDDFLQKHPKDVEAMLRALKKATDFINENPDEAASILGKTLNLEKEQTMHIMAENHYGMDMDQHFKATCEEMSSFMLRLGQIQDIPYFDNYVDSSPLHAVDNSLVTIK